MRSRSAGGTLAFAICVASLQACDSGQDSGTPGRDGGVVGTSDGAVPPLKFTAIGAAVPISTQFYFTEGPVWDPKKNVLYFTDINATQAGSVGGAVYQLTLPGTFDVLLQPDGNADGLGLDPQGNLIGAGFLSRNVWRLSSSNTMQTLAPCAASDAIDAGIDSGGADAALEGGLVGGSDAETDGGSDAATEDGGSTSVADAGADAEAGADAGTDDAATMTEVDATLGATPGDAALASGPDAAAMATTATTAVATCYSGQEINTPDDITSRSDGVLYFTDPTFASGSQGFPTLDLPLSGSQGVYRLTTDGTLHLEDSTTDGPNGVNLSPDEKTLYVSYTLTGQVAKFDVAADGSLSNKTTFATGATIADSMCVDSGDNVYVGTLSGLAVYDPSGTHLGTISVGGLIVTNCAFGGADQKTLFITARTQATLSGAPPMGGGALYAITNMPVPGIPGQN